MTFRRVSLRWLPMALVVGALVACSATITFDPIVRETVNAVASTDPDPVLTGESLAGGATAYYRVDVAQVRDLLYVEAEGSDLRVSLLRASGVTVGVANSTAFFASSLSTLEVSEVVTPSALVTSFTCLGPCVATRVSASTYYVRVDNRSTGGRTFDLYAYTMDENDTFEPNDAPSTAVDLSQAGTVSGAIETLGDVDWYRYTGPGDRELEFDAGNSALGLVLEIEFGPTVSPGGSNTIFAGERFRVRSTLDRAGAPAVSLYSITIGDVVPDAPDGSVVAQDTSDPTALLNGVTVPGSGTRVYEVQVPGARDLLYVEAVGSNVRVTLKSSDGNTLAVSQSPAYFGRTVADASGAATVDPLAITVSFACVGPCAAVERTSGTYLMEVLNLSSSSTTVDVYAYTFDENDTFEPNDGAGTAHAFSSADVLTGAIERLGDEDWFRYVGVSDRTLSFTVANQALGLRLRFLDGTILTGAPGSQTTSLFSDDEFWVESVVDRAGPSATSRYTIEVD